MSLLVTYSLYEEFVELVKGYEKKELWSEEGWNWRVKNKITSPKFWKEYQAEEIGKNTPINGVSYFEAEAFANSLELELPTEFEWEVAAGGGVYQYPWGMILLFLKRAGTMRAH